MDSDWVSEHFRKTWDASEAAISVRKSDLSLLVDNVRRRQCNVSPWRWHSGETAMLRLRSRPKMNRPSVSILALSKILLHLTYVILNAVAHSLASIPWLKSEESKSIHARTSFVLRYCCDAAAAAALLAPRDDGEADVGGGGPGRRHRKPPVPKALVIVVVKMHNDHGEPQPLKFRTSESPRCDGKG